jgi:pimeloyl-ACP methyl ester carboxylesterase
LLQRSSVTASRSFCSPGSDTTDPPWRDLTAPFGAPTLVLTGRNDQIAGYVDQFEDLARYPKASYVAINDAGH